MAIDPFISGLKASGVYRQTFDRSRVVTNASNITPIIFGFSKKGLFNTAVFCPDSEFFISNFGGIDYSLERKGSFFHRAALEALEQGPIFVLNLYGLSSEKPDTPPQNDTEFQEQLDDTRYDLTDYKGFSLGATIQNKPNIIEPVVNFYNRERFWFADTEALLNTNGKESDQLLSFVNLSQKSVSVIAKKSEVIGFDVSAKEWYGTGNVPDFMNETDLISDYFVDVYIFQGDFTDYENLAIDPVFGNYFDAQKGFKKELLSEFTNLPQVNLLGFYEGSVIPDFIDKNGSVRYLQTLVNQDTNLTGVLASINEEIFDDEYLSGTLIDLIGHNIEKETNEGLSQIEYLSYKDTITDNITYSQRELEINQTAQPDNEVYQIPVDGQIATADIATTADGRYILDDGDVIDVVGNANTGTVITAFEGLILYDNDTANTGANEGYFKYTAGSWVSTLEHITTVLTLEADATNIGGTSTGLPDGLHLDDATGDVVSVIGDAVIETVIAAGANPYVFFNDADSQYRYYDVTFIEDTSNVYVNGDVLVIGGTSTLLTDLTADYDISQLSDHVFILNNDGSYSKILQATDVLSSEGVVTISIDSLNGEIIDGENGIDSYEIIIDPIYNDVSASGDSYEVTEGIVGDTPQLYADIQNGIIVDGDRIVYNDGVSNVEGFIKIDSFIDETTFAYPTASTDADKVNAYRIGLYEDSTLSQQVIAADFPGFDGSLEFTVITLKGALNETFEITPVTNIPNEFILPAANAGDIKIGQYIVASPGTGSDSTNKPSRLTRVKKISTQENGDQKIQTADAVFIYKENPADTTGEIERYLPIEEFVDYYDMTHLYGFRIKDRLLPTAGDGDVSVYGVLTSTNLYNTLKDRSIISYRYIVDTFNKGLVAESKSLLTSLAREYKDAIAILNAPSAKQFAESADPVFTDAPTQTNPNPELNHRYLATGGNQALNPETTYSLPGESSGGAYGAFYYPNLVVSERNKTFTVPPAMYVVKNFIQKHRGGNPWDIVAGRRRGLISGRNVVGVETVLTKDDRVYLEPFGLNPITNEPGVGLKINSNQTAKQQIVTALSFVNVTEAIIEIQRGIEAILQNYLWEFNTAQNRLEIKTLADQFLQGVQLANGIYDFENVMDSSNNPPALIDQQKGIIDTYVEPVKGLGILVHRTTILNTGQIESGDFQKLS